VTFTKHIAPILQRSCENCHRADGVAPMSLVTYEDVRPWARAIKQRTGIGPKAGVMPPWYVEKNIGIQQFHNDPSLSDDEIAKIASGSTPARRAATPPTCRRRGVFAATRRGRSARRTRHRDDRAHRQGRRADWWGEIPSIPTGLTEDRYVAALEIKESTTSSRKSGPNRATVGRTFVFHHMIWRRRCSIRNRRLSAGSAAIFNDEEAVKWPVHESAANADFFDPKSARLLKAGSSIVSDSVHLHSNGRDTKSHLEIGFKLMPKDYKPTYKRAVFGLGNGVDIDIRGWKRTSSCTPTRCCSSTRRSSRSSRTSTRPARGCASRRSGATTSRR
jgi:hypothetical protein